MSGGSSSSSSSSCRDDSETSIFDNPNFFTGEPDKMAPSSIPQFSLVGTIFSKSKENPRKRACVSDPVQKCKNCGIFVYKLVFNCACSVECALGYYQYNTDVIALIQARYCVETNYSKLKSCPLAIYPVGFPTIQSLYACALKLYNTDDPRLQCYLKQLRSNIVRKCSTFKH